MPQAYLNKIATHVPPNDVHRAFVKFADGLLQDDRRGAAIFTRMVERAGIEHRYSYFQPVVNPQSPTLDEGGFFRPGAFPGTGARMRLFETHAAILAQEAVEKLDLGSDRDRITHLLLTCCTGLSAPGIDLEVIERCRLNGSVERTVIGFMGCYAAINALKLARHIVRSESEARVLIVNIELCTLHLKETTDLEEILSLLLFGDGCAASIVSSEPVGLGLDRFRAVYIPGTRDLITWDVGDFGFDMMLSGRVPSTIHDALQSSTVDILDGARIDSIDAWAVHPGGRSVLDAVERAFGLGPAALAISRDILRHYGNMSSATVMFVLHKMLGRLAPGASGCAMAFGPGLIAETMLFHAAG